MAISVVCNYVCIKRSTAGSTIVKATNSTYTVEPSSFICDVAMRHATKKKQSAPAVYSAAWLEIKCSSSSTSRIEIIHLPPPEEFLTRGGFKWNLLDHLCKHRWRHVAKNNQFFCPAR